MNSRICDVVVIDTMAAVTPGANENSSEDIGLLLDHCKLIAKELNALVLLVAHVGKDASKNIRGWSGTRGAADAIFEVTRNGDYRVMTAVKQKDAEDGASYPFKLKVIPLGEDEDGEEISSCVVEHVETAMPAERSTKKVKLGTREQTVFDLLQTMAPSGTMAVEDLVEGYKTKVPRGDGRDQRRAHAFLALNGLIAKKKAFMHGEDRVSLTSLVTTGNYEAWLG